MIIDLANQTGSARRIIRDLIATGTTHPKIVRRPWIGIDVTAVPDRLAAELDLPAYRGVLIHSVIAESPANVAGIGQDDIVLEVDAKETGDERDVREAIQSHKVGDRIQLRIVRAGTRNTEQVAVVLRERPDERPAK